MRLSGEAHVLIRGRTCCCDAKGTDRSGSVMRCSPMRPGGFISVCPESQSRKKTGPLWRVTSLAEQLSAGVCVCGGEGQCKGQTRKKENAHGRSAGGDKGAAPHRFKIKRMSEDLPESLGPRTAIQNASCMASKSCERRTRSVTTAENVKGDVPFVRRMLFSRHQGQAHCAGMHG